MAPIVIGSHYRGLSHLTMAPITNNARSKISIVRSAYEETCRNDRQIRVIYSH